MASKPRTWVWHHSKTSAAHGVNKVPAPKAFFLPLPITPNNEHSRAHLNHCMFEVYSIVGVYMSFYLFIGLREES